METEQNQRALVELGRALQQREYRFTTCTPWTHEQVNRRPGNALASDLRGVFGWSRPFEPSLLGDELRHLMEAADVLGQADGHWQSAVRWSSLNDTLLVHSRFPTDDADSVFFGPDTYRFVRAIDAFLASPASATIKRAVDIGCGAGPGAIRIASSRPAAEVLALDINPRALEFTRINAELAGVHNVEARYSDLLGGVDGELDLIVANPPYMLDLQGRTYRDGGGELGMGLSLAIVEAALPRLAPGASLLLYTGIAMTASGDSFLRNLQPLLDRDNLAWRYEEVDPDVFAEELLKPGYEQVERIAAVVLTVTRRA